jgi:uncharacterized protein YcgI (DUF1989 family)
MTSYAHEIPGGAVWSTPVRAGRWVTFTALGPDANLSTLIIGADRLDRLNIPDTLKAQLSACIKPPMVLMSDRGLALASMVDSTLPWHDAFTGLGAAARAGLSIELGKHGLGEADLHGCVNFFSKVAVADDVRASLRYVTGYSRQGDSVTLRTEQDVLLIVAATPHPLDTAGQCAAVRVEVAVADLPGPDDPAELFRDESARALAQTRKVFL